MTMMMTILFVFGTAAILLGISMIQEVFGVSRENVIEKAWTLVRFVFSGFWSGTKKGAVPVIMTFSGLMLVAIGVSCFWFVSFKTESDKERENGILGMSRLDWHFVSQAARKGDGGRVWHERAWLGDKLEIQHSEMQRHAHPESTLVRVYLPGPVDGSLFYEVFPNGEAKEWRMPPTPPIFPKK